MLKLGEMQVLNVVKVLDFGLYLSAPGQEEVQRVLLPKKQAPADAAPGDKIEVFVYRDSEDRLISTTKRPQLCMGEVAELKVVEEGKIGFFLDWGLEKDLFLPFRQCTYQPKKGDGVLAALYIDKSTRLCATMKVYPFLETASPYQKGDKVSGIVYEGGRDFGLFVAVDKRYSGLIPFKEAYGGVALGDRITARVSQVRPDGKLNLSVREPGHIQMEADGQKLLALLEENGGVLLLTDKSSPEEILRWTGMSKKEFKRALGGLFKKRRVDLREDCILLK